MMTLTRFVLFSAVLSGLCGCATLPNPTQRAALAQALAEKAGFTPLHLKAAPFTYTAWLHTPEQADTLRVYIEGDGITWQQGNTPSPDPTPAAPTALKLATLDNAPMVAWMPRACQYTGRHDDICSPQYWTAARYAPEVVSSFSKALDALKTRTHAKNLELVGFGGGGGLAMILAQKRPDIKSIRTIAAVLDTTAFTRYNGISLMKDSINPGAHIGRVAQIPQIHFAAARDWVMPPQVTESVLYHMPHPNCAQLRIIPKLTHEGPWAPVWPQLLKTPLPCTTGHE